MTFLLFLAVSALFSFTSSLPMNFTFIGIAAFILFLEGKFKTYILYPVYRFRLFLTVSFVFSYIISHDAYSASMILIRFSILMILAVWLNLCIDFKKLLSFQEHIADRIPCLRIKDFVKKSSRSVILGIDFSASLIAEVNNAGLSRENCGRGAMSLIRKNTHVLLSLFYYALEKAEKLESEFPAAAPQNEKNRSAHVINKADSVLLIFSAASVIFTFYIV